MDCVINELQDKWTVGEIDSDKLWNKWTVG